MSTSLETLIRLRAIQNKTRALFDTMDEDTYRSIHHPQMHSAAWYLAYGIFIENYFLRDVIQGKKRTTKKYYPLFFKQRPSLFRFKPRLPALKKFLQLIKQQQDQNDLWLLQKTPPLSEHELFNNEYIENYIIQHYANQYQQLQYLLNQRAINSDPGSHIPETPLSSRPILQNIASIAAMEHEIGCDDIIACDNEQPVHSVSLDSFNIAGQPVSNAEYLAFIEDAGYQQQQYWSEQGWQWREQNRIQSPNHWKQNSKNDWYGIRHEGAFDLADNEPVYGLSHFEASAFARWANARLPHEYEWEAAARQEKLGSSGKVLEWCQNHFFYYASYRPFPLMPGQHTTNNEHLQVLRGADFMARPELRRASIRHVYSADSRYMTGGLRLVFI